MDPKHIVIFAFQLSIICTVLGFGLHTKRNDLLYLWRRPGLMAKSLLSVLLVMPIVAVVMQETCNFPRATELALVALSLSPLPPLLPTKTDRAGGGHSYMVALLVTLSLTAIVVIPLSGAILSWMFHREFHTSFVAIARIVITMILAPLLVGFAIRRRLPELAERLAPIAGWIAKVLLPLAVVALLAAAWRSIWSAVGDGSIFAITLFVVIGLCVGHWLGRPVREQSVVLALASACRHPAIALTIASANFPDIKFVGTVLLYVLVSTLVGVPYVMWQRRAECPPSPSPPPLPPR